MTKKQVSKRKSHPVGGVAQNVFGKSDFTREDCCMEGEGIVSFLRCSGCDAGTDTHRPPDEDED